MLKNQDTQGLWKCLRSKKNKKGGINENWNK